MRFDHITHKAVTPCSVRFPRYPSRRTITHNVSNIVLEIIMRFRKSCIGWMYPLERKNAMPRKILCVNIDHIATIREARGGTEPDPIAGARICEQNGAAGITVHLREDRRHIQDRDVITLRDIVIGKFNLEMALSDDIIGIARSVLPDQITLVPEKREELTTEGGLNVMKNESRIRDLVVEFKEKAVVVSLFIEPDLPTIDATKRTGADFIEIHTGSYCNAGSHEDRSRELQRIYRAAEHAVSLGIRVNAGHGLNYTNVRDVLRTPGLEELNIGHSIIAQSVFTGLATAVRDMAILVEESNA